MRPLRKIGKKYHYFDKCVHIFIYKFATKIICHDTQNIIYISTLPDYDGSYGAD